MYGINYLLIVGMLVVCKNIIDKYLVKGHTCILDGRIPQREEVDIVPTFAQVG